MGRIIAIDFGLKRTGLAHTDPEKIIASGLCTLPTQEVLPFLKKHLEAHEVETFVIGYPQQKDGSPSAIEEHILPFLTDLKRAFPKQHIERYAERFTSKIAWQTMQQSNLKKKQRQNKALIDKISATLILQSYLTFQSRDL